MVDRSINRLAIDAWAGTGTRDGRTDRTDRHSFIHADRPTRLPHNCAIAPLGTNLQEPSFKAFQAAAEARFVARKESRAFISKARVVILAFNVAGQYGLHAGWRLNVGSFNGNPLGVNGLGNASAVQCGTPPACVLNTSCSTIWFQPTNTACSDISAFTLSVNATESDFTDEATASIAFDLRAQGVSEGRYSFVLHLPVANSTAWQYQPINGMLDVQAVADAQLSEVSLGSVQGAETWVNHLEALEIVVVARDVDGARINRTRELIVVRIASTDRTANQTEIAQFNAIRAVYFVEVTIGQPGEHTVYIVTEAGVPVRKARIWVACVYGYAEVRGECVQTDATRNIALGSVFGTLLLGFLGLLVYMIRAHRDRWKAFLISFLKHEGVIALKVLWEVWDISGTSRFADSR